MLQSYELFKKVKKSFTKNVFFGLWRASLKKTSESPEVPNEVP